MSAETALTSLLTHIAFLRVAHDLRYKSGHA